MHPTTGLILSGGGARAAYQVGVLAAIERLRQSCAPSTDNPYPVICGTSAGAINAATLGCGADRFAQTLDELVGVWRDFHVEQVYRSDMLDMLGSGIRWLSMLSLGWLLASRRLRPRALLDNSPLAQLLRSRVDTSRLPRLLDEGHLRALAITASSYSNGEHATFYQSHQTIAPWQRTQRLAYRCQLSLPHLLASSAIPFIFPAVCLDGPRGSGYFGDGSMRQTAPIAPAIHLGAERILVIGAGRMQEPAEPRPSESTYPTLGQIAGHVLSSIFLDALAVDVERLQRINQTLQLIPPEHRNASRLRPVQLLLIAPSQRLDHMAAAHLSCLPTSVRSLLRMLGDEASATQGHALLSYLLFESDYTRELMALGEQDAQRQENDIREFFGWPAAPGAAPVSA
ncbi:MAG: patatin-like phospholipase family protein [Betaproteobacteria bacterium]|nr:patatin-like phospholipase family protein [Betaproteobacteria bacterium]